MSCPDICKLSNCRLLLCFPVAYNSMASCTFIMDLPFCELLIRAKCSYILYAYFVIVPHFAKLITLIL